MTLDDRASRQRRSNRILAGVFVLSAAFWLTCLVSLRHSDPVLHEADGVTGCGELTVGEVSVTLWGVEFHDCAGANAFLQAQLVDRPTEFHVTRGACRLREPASAPVWDCQYPDSRRAMPEREPPKPGPIGEPRVEALVERFRAPSWWTAQADLIRAGLARISDACVAELDAAARDPLRRWPEACQQLWLAQCRHDHDVVAAERAWQECRDRYRDPS